MMDQPPLFAVPRVRPWPGIVGDWMERDPGMGLNFIASLSKADRDWLLSEATPVYCRPLAGRILPFSWPDLVAFCHVFQRADGEPRALVGDYSTTWLGEFWTMDLPDRFTSPRASGAE